MAKTVNLGPGSDAKGVETRDVRLAAALMAVGVKPEGSEPVHVITRADRGGEAVQFVFPPKSEDGKYETAMLVKAWREGFEWVRKNPDHPFAYAMAAMANHRALLDWVKSAERQVMVMRGKSVGMLPLNASAALEEKILGRFGK